MNPVLTTKLQSTNVLVLVFSAFTLSLGVAVTANYITAYMGTTISLLIFGLFFIVLSLYLIFKWANPKVKNIIRIRGGFFFDEKTLKSKEIIGYEFNQDMGSYLRAIATENKAYAVALKKKERREIYDPNALGYYTLAASCAEFVFLKQLGFHLNSYFVEEEIDSSKIHIIPRSELSKDVLKNRVLELITRDANEREAFCETEQNVIYSMTHKGEVFSKFDLELPTGSTISRCEKNYLKIENKFFQLNFLVNCKGVHTVILPELFKGEEYDAPVLIEAKLEILIKKRFFLSSSQIELYKWLDSFVKRFENYMSIKKLHERSNIQLIKILKNSI